MRSAVKAVAFVFNMVVLLILLTPSEAQARPCCKQQILFYSDCTFTVVVGEDSVECTGLWTQWGTTTSNARSYALYSCDNGSCCYGPGCTEEGSCTPEGPDYVCY